FPFPESHRQRSKPPQHKPKKTTPAVCIEIHRRDAEELVCEDSPNAPGSRLNRIIATRSAGGLTARSSGESVNASRFSTRFADDSSIPSPSTTISFHPACPAKFLSSYSKRLSPRGWAAVKASR